MKKVELKDLCRTYGRAYAIYNVTHTFPAGRCTAILGGNGAGKSTLLNMIATLEAPSRGSITYDGHSFEHFAQKGRARIGYLSHETLVYPELTGRENLRFFADMYAVDDPDAVVDKWLRRVGLEHAANQLASSYSRGMVQRLTIARALLHTPQLILLDEPFTGLDQGARRDMSYIFSKLRDAGCIVIMITHDFSIDPSLVDEVLLLKDGEVANSIQLFHLPLDARPTLHDIYEGRTGDE